MKYVVFKTGFGEDLVILPATMSHKDMKAMGLPIVSAGMIYRSYSSPSGFKCYGESITLNMKCRPVEDNFLLSQTLGRKDD